MLSLWSDSSKHFRANSGYAAGYVLSSAVVAAVYRLADAAVGAAVDKQEPPLWIPFFRLGSLLWLAVGASLCAAVFFSLIGTRVDKPLWRCAGWRDGVRRFFLPWFILNLCMLVVIDSIVRFSEAGIGGPLSTLMMVYLAFSVMILPVGTCIMHWGRLDWGKLGGALEPIYGQFLLVLPVLFIGLVQWILIDLRSAVIPSGLELEILWLGLYDAVLDFITCFAFVMMWRVCMVHREQSMQGGGNPFDF